MWWKTPPLSHSLHQRPPKYSQSIVSTEVRRRQKMQMSEWSFQILSDQYHHLFLWNSAVFAQNGKQVAHSAKLLLWWTRSFTNRTCLLALGGSSNKPGPLLTGGGSMAAPPPALSLLSAYFPPPSGLGSNTLLTEAAMPLPLSLQPHAHFPPTLQPSLPCFCSDI